MAFQERTALWAAYWALQAVRPLTPTLLAAADELHASLFPGGPSTALDKSSQADQGQQQRARWNLERERKEEWWSLAAETKERLVLEALGDELLTNREIRERIERTAKLYPAPQAMHPVTGLLCEAGRLIKHDVVLDNGRAGKCQYSVAPLPADLRELEEALGEGGEG